ncbi:E3 ubiquitin-protein ligase TRIM71 [Exaiptasia diaphana]|uniref:B box-type domain-containing protein n=1 Tax=Exaiptasia diaphana TaxID=2652724 RepID=A0A913YF07_EXADI|nr:E3 ubiquitin-protein ligase TRIM71 [Exaiptasia diaphana]
MSRQQRDKTSRKSHDFTQHLFSEHASYPDPVAKKNAKSRSRLHFKIPHPVEIFVQIPNPAIKNRLIPHPAKPIVDPPHCTSLTELQELNDVDDLEISPIHSRILQVLSFIENQKVCSVSASHSDASFQCLDCDRSLCDECLNNHSIFIKDHKVISLSAMTKEDIQSMLKKETPCKSHVNQDVKLYCSDCNELICHKCLIDHHNNHKTRSLEEFIAIQKDSLFKNLEEIEKMEINEYEKKQQEQIALDIKRDGQKAQKLIKKLTKQLKKKLDDNEEELLNTVQKSVTKADRNLRIIRHSPAAKEYINYFIQNGTASEIIALQSDTRCSKAVTYNAFEKDLCGMKFQPNEQLCEQVDSGVGLILQAIKRADPNNSSLQAVGENGFEAMKNATLKVTLRTYKDELCEPQLDDVTIHITPEDDVQVGKKQVTTDGLTEVSFTPRVPGQLTAEVQVHGNPVSNSPLVMDVKPQHIMEMTKITKLKEALNTGSKNFTGIVVNKSNTKIAVADWKACCVRVFSMDGDSLLSYGSKGSGQGQLNGPSGLAFLNETDLVIADYNNNRICIVDTTSGTLTRTFGCLGNMNGQFSQPRGVHVDGDSNIIVCDKSNRVQVFTKNGDYLYQFTIPLEQSPYDVVTHNGLFYVSADGSVVNVIKMTDNQSPTTITSIGGEDYTDGRLHYPAGLAIDCDNNLRCVILDQWKSTSLLCMVVM